MIKYEFPHVDTLHVLSDGPTTQYRNKKNLYLLTKLVEADNITRATWNFSESGHGKGAADGVGAVVKRTADVATGTDLPEANTLFNVLRKQSLKVRLFFILDVDIDAYDAILSSVILKPVPGTMKLHQVTTARNRPGNISLIYLTCMECNYNTACRPIHFDVGSLEYEDWAS